MEVDEVKKTSLRKLLRMFVKSLYLRWKSANYD